MDDSFQAPRGFDAWLETLQHQKLGLAFEPDLAAWVRVIAGSRGSGVFFSSGGESLPYADWLQDGMLMTSRLIVHNQSKAADKMAAPHYATDIRVATHYQDIESFLVDMARHEFDVMMIDFTDVDIKVAPTTFDRLSNHGLLIGLGNAAALSQLVRDNAQTYFSANLTQTGNCVVFSKKGMQHLAVRRGGRRKHRSA